MEPASRTITESSFSTSSTTLAVLLAFLPIPIRRGTCLVTVEEMNAAGEKVKTEIEKPRKPSPDRSQRQIIEPGGRKEKSQRKFYVDQGSVEIAAHFVSELDAEGKQLRVVSFTDYTAEKYAGCVPRRRSSASKWSVADQRAEIIHALEERGITLEELTRLRISRTPTLSTFCVMLRSTRHLRTRRERAEMLHKDKKDFFDQYGPKRGRFSEKCLISI